MLRSRIPSVIKSEILKPKTPVYYYVKEAKQGKWKLGFVAEALEHLVTVMTNSEGRGHKLGIAYEQIRWSPPQHCSTKLINLNLNWHTILQRNPRKVSIRWPRIPVQENQLQFLKRRKKDPPSAEAALWTNHPLSRTIYYTKGTSVLNEPAFDIGKENNQENIGKDIEEYQYPPAIHFQMNLANKRFENRIKSVIGDKSVSEAKLHFAPSWILEKAKKKEYANYMDSVQVVSRSSVP